MNGNNIIGNGKLIPHYSAILVAMFEKYAEQFYFYGGLHLPKRRKVWNFPYLQIKLNLFTRLSNRMRNTVWLDMHSNLTYIGKKYIEFLKKYCLVTG